jgi:hypothetical protein
MRKASQAWITEARLERRSPKARLERHRTHLLYPKRKCGRRDRIHVATKPRNQCSAQRCTNRNKHQSALHKTRKEAY